MQESFSPHDMQNARGLKPMKCENCANEEFTPVARLYYRDDQTPLVIVSYHCTRCNRKYRRR